MPATISSSSHARQCSSSGEGSRPALTASATATSRFAVHSSLTCPSLEKEPSHSRGSHHRVQHGGQEARVAQVSHAAGPEAPRAS